jgi:hypothetical protein
LRSAVLHIEVHVWTGEVVIDFNAPIVLFVQLPVLTRQLLRGVEVKVDCLATDVVVHIQIWLLLLGLTGTRMSASLTVVEESALFVPSAPFLRMYLAERFMSAMSNR